MNSNKKTPLLPRMRFPEFRATEGWKRVPLSELVSALDAGVSVNSGDRPATGNEIGILKTSAVTNGIFEPQENKVVFDEVERGRVKEPVQAGTIIISRMNTPALVGANAFVETSLENIFLPDRLWAAKSKPGTSMRFVAYILGSDKGRAALSKFAKGSSGSMKNITKPDVFAFLIEAPLPDEQKKIADCLSSLDELIAAQARKVDALKTHKQGLMQQLFPREGETQPRLRFPEFRDAKAWVWRKLGEFSDVSASGDLDSSTFSPERSEEHCFPIYSNAVEKEGIYGFSSVARNKANSVTITARGSLGKAFLRTTDFVGIGRLIVVSNFEDDVDSAFLKECWDHRAVIPQEVTSIPQLTAVAARATSLPFPTLAEQQRIASCLSSLDVEITAETQELETLKTHKKGLMQQLFPFAEMIQYESVWDV